MTLMLASSARVIENDKQTLLLDLESRKWIRMTTEGFRAVKAVLDRSSAATEEQISGLSGNVVRNTIEHLQQKGFLTEPGVAACETGRAHQSSKGLQVLHLHVTQRCNLACKTCYVSDFIQKDSDRLSFEDISSIFDVCAEVGCSRVDISGGEPLLRRDLVQILKRARQLFEIVTLTTNGIKLDDQTCAKLANLVDFINISLDGSTAEINDRVRGRGSFKKALTGLMTLKSSGFPMQQVAITPTATNMNHENLEDVLDIADRFGAAASFGFFMPTGRGLCNQDELFLSPAHMLSLFERAGEKRLQQLNAPRQEPGCFRSVRTGCHIEGIIDIQADGSIFPCPNLNQQEHLLGNFFDLSRDQLVALLSSSKAKEAFCNRTVTRVEKCSACDARYFCGGGCMANAYAATGDLFGIDPLCSFYQAIWKHHGPLSDQEDRATARRIRA
jgi:radical SAM protein with 4Fe4S-binding SPASM domain